MDPENTEQGAGGQTQDTASQGEAVPAWANDLKSGVGELTGAIRQMLEFGQRTRAEQAAAQQPADDEDEGDPAELETMSRSDFGRHIVGQVLKAVNKQVVEPLNSQLQQVTAATTRTQIQGSVKELAAAHKDFWDWQPEMLALANEHRGLAPQRLYQLARADNPTKATDLDKKYAPKPEGSGPIRFKGFGGLTPSQSGTASRGGKMNGSEAANAAWAETVAALGGEPIFEE
jgi:hypothetical protein